MTKLLIPRRLPDSMMARGGARFAVTTRDTTEPMRHDECVAALAKYDV
ncbi:MAG: hypothetical protein GDA52_01080 [Rhodobacteraceae bacterium]|nr:hypothetical protein [Paracoccaceae bacterium]